MCWLRRFMLMLQRMDRQITDITVMFAIAPGPVPDNIEKLEIFTVQEFRHGFVILATLLADHGLWRGAAHRHWRDIMRREHVSGQRNIGKIVAIRRGPPLKAFFGTWAAKFCTA